MYQKVLYTENTKNQTLEDTEHISMKTTALEYKLIDAKKEF